MRDSTLLNSRELFNTSQLPLPRTSLRTRPTASRSPYLRIKLMRVQRHPEARVVIEEVAREEAVVAAVAEEKVATDPPVRIDPLVRTDALVRTDPLVKVVTDPLVKVEIELSVITDPALTAVIADLAMRVVSAELAPKATTADLAPRVVTIADPVPREATADLKVIEEEVVTLEVVPEVEEVELNSSVMLKAELK